MLLAQGQICGKNMAFYMPVGCVRFARYCGKMYSRRLFPYGGLRMTLSHKGHQHGYIVAPRVNSGDDIGRCTTRDTYRH